METNKSYFGGAFGGLKTLLTGMGVTWKEFFKKKVTEQYPENRHTQHIAERHRGTLIMPHDAEGNNKCVACKLCEMACPNGTIKVIPETVTTADGKKKKVLKDYIYDLGDCMFCQLCVNACPHDAITFVKDFENAVFDRTKLVQHLNIYKPYEEKPAAEAPAKAEAPAAKAEPKAEAPKAEAPKAEAPKAEVKAETPAAEASKAETPKAEAPKAETPKAEAPKAAEQPEAPVKEEPKKEEDK